MRSVHREDVSECIITYPNAVLSFSVRDCLQVEAYRLTRRVYLLINACLQLTQNGLWQAHVKEYEIRYQGIYVAIKYVHFCYCTDTSYSKDTRFADAVETQ